MALRLKNFDYVYDDSHDIDDVIRQYNNLTPGHSKIKKLRAEFDKLNPTIKPGAVLQIPVTINVAKLLHEEGNFKLENVIVANAVHHTPQVQVEQNAPNNPAPARRRHATSAPPVSHPQPPKVETQSSPINKPHNKVIDTKQIKTAYGGVEVRPGFILKNGCLLKVVDLTPQLPVQSEPMLKD